MAGEPPLDRRTAHALGVALATWAQRSAQETGDGGYEVLIGMDTRESGPWLASAVAGGLKQGGVKARFAGVITTPGVAYLTRTGPFAAGVMISASHNPYHDNGLKVISHSGYKLPDATELELEKLMTDWLESGAEAVPAELALDRSLDRLYESYLLGIVSGQFPFHLAIDCANGSATEVAPHVFERLGVKVDWIGASPDGRNINLDCGSLHLANLQRRVLETGADFGIAFDGDADRALFVSGGGKVVDGDAVLFLAGSALKRAGKLPGDVVVATVMSNIGLEKALATQSIEMVRTPVGDKYVLEQMLERGSALGGEQSGHVIFSQYATTGDGILTALAGPADCPGLRAHTGRPGRRNREFPSKAGEHPREDKASACRAFLCAGRDRCRRTGVCGQRPSSGEVFGHGTAGASHGGRTFRRGSRQVDGPNRRGNSSRTRQDKLSGKLVLHSNRFGGFRLRSATPSTSDSHGTSRAPFSEQIGQSRDR